MKIGMLIAKNRKEQLPRRASCVPPGALQGTESWEDENLVTKPQQEGVGPVTAQGLHLPLSVPDPGGDKCPWRALSGPGGGPGEGAAWHRPGN